jgi:hypothetical protein
MVSDSHYCAQYQAHHHFQLESNGQDIVVLKFQTHLYALNSVVLHLKGWKLCYSKIDVSIQISCQEQLVLKLDGRSGS